MSFRRVTIGAVAAIALLAFLMPATWRTFHGFMLVARAVSPHGVVHALARLDAVDVKERLRGRTRVRLLVTDLISHADADQAAHTTDVLRLAAFWGDLLSR